MLYRGTDYKGDRWGLDPSLPYPTQLFLFKFTQ